MLCQWRTPSRQAHAGLSSTYLVRALFLLGTWRRCSSPGSLLGTWGRCPRIERAHWLGGEWYRRVKADQFTVVVAWLGLDSLAGCGFLEKQRWLRSEKGIGIQRLVGNWQIDCWKLIWCRCRMEHQQPSLFVAWRWAFCLFQKILAINHEEMLPFEEKLFALKSPLGSLLILIQTFLVIDPSVESTRCPIASSILVKEVDISWHIPPRSAYPESSTDYFWAEKCILWEWLANRGLSWSLGLEFWSVPELLLSEIQLLAFAVLHSIFSLGKLLILSNILPLAIRQRAFF